MNHLKHALPMGLLVLGVGCEAPPAPDMDSTAQALSLSEAIRLDPTEVIGPTLGNAREAIAASSPEGYLLAWCQDGHRVAARYAPDATRLDEAPIAVFDSCSEAGLAYGDSGFLMVQWNRQGGVGQVSARTISLSGVLGTERSVAVDYINKLELVGGGAGFLLGYHTTQDRYAVRRLTSDGVPMDRVLVGDGDQAWLAFDGTEYVVAWPDADRLVAKKFRTDSKIDLSAPVALSQWLGPPTDVALAFVKDRLILSRPGRGVELFNADLNSLGEVDAVKDLIPAEYFETIPDSTEQVSQPTIHSVTPIGDRALFVWTGPESSLQAAILDPTQAKLTTAAFPIGATSVMAWGAAGVGTQSVLAWSNEGPDHSEAWSTTIDTSGNLSAKEVLAVGPNQQWMQAAVTTDEGALATWLEWRDGAYHLFNRSVSSQGEPNGEVHELGSTAYRSERSHLAYSGTNALAAWTALKASGTHWQVVSSRGEPISDEFSTPERLVSGVASNGSSYVLAGYDLTSSTQVLTRIRLDGSEGRTIPLGSHTGCALAAWKDYLVVCGGDGVLTALEFDEDLQSIGWAETRFTSDAEYSLIDNITLAYAAGQYLVGYRMDGVSQVAQLDPHGNMIGSKPLNLQSPIQTSFAFDGTAWVISAGSQLVRIDASGSIEATSIQDKQDDLPVLLTSSCTGATQAFYGTSDVVSRVVTRRVYAEGSAPSNSCSGTSEQSTGGCSVSPNGNSGQRTPWALLCVTAVSVLRRKRRRQ